MDQVRSGLEVPAAQDDRRRLAFLDGWRGMSILLVLIGHFFALLQPHVYLATIGVELFFVLSGRLMAEILFVERFPLGRFFKRRVSRIYPALLVFVIVIVLLPDTLFPVGPGGILSALTFTLNYFSVFRHATGIFDHIWSLCVEEHAYILLGAIAWLTRRRTKLVTTILALGAALAMLNGWVSYAMLKQDYTAVYWRTDVHIASIFAAAALYLLLRPHLGSIGAHPILRWLSPIALALGFAFSIEAMPAEYHFILGTLCFATAVITLEAAPNIIRAAFSWPALTWFGVLSYSLYLWQQPFYKLLDHYPAALPFLLAGALAAGLASYHFIEQPARRFLNRVWV